MSRSSPALPLLLQADIQTINAGLALLDEFMDAFNSRDSQRWSRVMNYPHVRFAGDTVAIWNTPEEYAASNDLSLLEKTGWRYSRWDFRHLVHADADKQHFAIQFTRYDASDRPLGSYQALYILTRQSGRWGVQSRSSYAGVLAAGAAF
jgi:hypothetical protein